MTLVKLNKAKQYFNNNVLGSKCFVYNHTGKIDLISKQLQNILTNCWIRIMYAFGFNK